MYSLGLFIDLSRAFDCVDHSILLHKFERYGIRGVAGKWFESYLSGRRQTVSVGGVISRVFDVTLGVPQGSILGPTMFLLYINDLPRCVDGADVTLYADDCNIFVSAESPERLYERASTTYACILEWMATNRLVVNETKTKCLLFFKNNIETIQLGTTSVSVDRACRLLGVVVDAQLRWDDHIDGLSGRLRRTCFVLYQLKKHCSIEIVKTFYFA